MDESHGAPGEPKHRPTREYEDPHYHDEDEVAPVEDAEPRNSRPATRRRPMHRPPPRRYYED